MATQRALVIGAGMVGLSTAWHLQRRGFEVTVVDRTGVSAGSSRGNAGWLAPALTLPLPEPAIFAVGIQAMLSPNSPVYVPLSTDPNLLRFLTGFAWHCRPQPWKRAIEVFVHANAAALGAYEELADSGEAPVAGVVTDATPHLAAFATHSDRAVMVEEFARVADAGGHVDYQLLSTDDIHQLEPAVAQGVTCGIAIHGQRFINPGRYVASLADAVRAVGGEVRSGADVTGISGGSGAVRVTLDSGETLSADHVVVATGSWIGRLVREHGVKQVVQAGRGYSFTVYPEHVPTNPIYLPTQRVACTPLGSPEDGFRVAGMMEFRSPDAPLDPRRIKAIVDAARPMLQGIDWDRRDDEWVGSRPCTADGLPLLGRTRTEGVWVAGGHGMWGVALGPLSGRLLADEISGRRTDPLLRSFDPLR